MSTLPDSAGIPAQPSDGPLLSAIVDSSDDAIISKNLEGVITSWNPSAERIFGYTPAEIIGQSIKTLLPPDREAEEEDGLAQLRRGERVDHFETVRQRKDGSLIHVSVSTSPIRDGAAGITGASHVLRDITEHKLSGEAGLLLAAIVNSSDDAIVSKNLNGIITSWNQGAERIFGYRAEETIGRPVAMLIPADRQDEEVRILERLRRGERVDHFETIRVRKDGQSLAVSLTISPIRDLSGNIIGASKIARDITELKRIRAEREQLLESERAARAQAEHANRLKDDFLATVSHELRTPLNAIVGWTQVMKEGQVPEEEIKLGIEVIERNARSQAQLIEDLLDLSRITSGKMTLDVEWLELTSVVQEAMASVQHAADSKGIRMETVQTTVRTGLMGDKHRLQQVVWNLLSNSIKFTPKDGTVVITVSRQNSHLEIAVSDNGRGITPDFLPLVFERFRQADSSTTRQHGGLGIGLALVRQLVELHGGQVRAESPGLGRGATFVVSLPIIAARSGPKPPAPNSTVEDTSQIPAETLLDIKVLVVDDDKDSLDVIGRILTARKAQVQTVTSVIEALKAYSAFRPDVILSDIGMPGQDGYDLIRGIRELPGGRSTPAAALTALARSEDRMRALKAGFQSHVTKPVAAAELVAVVRSLSTLRAQRED